MPIFSILQARWRHLLLVYLLALGVLAGPAYTMYVHYDFSHSLDTRSYLAIAHGEFAGQSVTRRYRVLVPAVAAAVAWPVEKVYARIWPQRAATDWPLRLAFYLVNTLLMAAAGVVLYRTCLLYGATPAAAALAMTGVLCSRWAVYITGLPLVDSLYILVFALAFYGVRARSGGALVAVLLLGPMAKESFVFLVPWLLWYGRPALAWPRQLGWLAVGAGLALVVRHWIDVRAGSPFAQSVTNALNHSENIAYSLRRLFSVKGAGEIFSIFGFFWLVLLAGWRGRAAAGRPQWVALLGMPALWFGLVVVVHMLLSSELARMGYLAAPVFAVAMALAIKQQLWLREPSDTPAVEANG
jgi:hypothetical protein